MERSGANRGFVDVEKENEGRKVLLLLHGVMAQSTDTSEPLGATPDLRVRN